VTNFGLNTVAVIDTATNLVILSIPVGGSTPLHIAITPDGTRVYVTNSSSGNVSVIDTATNTVIGLIFTGSSPIGIAITPDGTKAYVAKSTTNSVAVIDIATNTVLTSIPGFNQPTGVATFQASQASVTGHCKTNEFIFQTELYNLITWSAPQGFLPIQYLIFRDAAHTNLLGSVNNNTFKFIDHNRKKNRTYTYYVVAVTSSGSLIPIGNVTVTSNCQ